MIRLIPREVRKVLQRVAELQPVHQHLEAIGAEGVEDQVVHVRAGRGGIDPNLLAPNTPCALHLDDVLTRRTRISIETFDRGVAAAQSVASRMGEVLGWSQSTRAREIHHYEARVAAERESQEQPDDRTADAARLGAPDVRVGGGATTEAADEPEHVSAD